MKSRQSYYQNSCLYLLFAILPFLLQAQSAKMNFERLTTKEGLPNDLIEGIAQDKEGFLWVATQGGVAKYDGYHFQTYRNIIGDTTSLNDNGCQTIFIGALGDIWIGTRTGLNRYEATCDCFIRYSNPLSNSNGPFGKVNAITEDHNNNIWIGTQKQGLFRYERDKNKFTRFLDNPNDVANLLNDQIFALLVDKQNQLWIGTGETFDLAITGGGLIRFDIETGRAKRFLNDPNNPNSLIDNRVSALMEDKDGTIWAGTCQSGLHYFDTNKEVFIRMMPDPNNPIQLHAPQGGMGKWFSCPAVRIIHQDKKDAFWIGTFNGGLNQFDLSANKINEYRPHPTNIKSLSNNMIYRFLEDRQGRFWVGNLSGGLHKIDPYLHKFDVYLHDPYDVNSLSSNQIAGIYEAPSEPEIIWIATNAGLNRLDLNTNRFTRFRHNAPEVSSINSDNVFTIFEDTEKVLWIGTGEGLDILNRQTSKFSHIKIDTKDSLNTTIINIYEDQHGILWLGTWGGGVIRYNREKNSFKRFSLSIGIQPHFDNSIFTIQEDTRGVLWVSTFMGGLYKYDDKLERFIIQLKGYGGLSFEEDNLGKFWIGTETNGLLHFNPNDGTFQQYTIEDGLPGIQINSILTIPKMK